MSPARSYNFDSLYAGAPCGLIITTLDGTVLEANRTFLAWTGFTRAEFVGTTFQSHLGAASRSVYESRHLPALRSEGAIQEVSLLLHCADEAVLPILTNSVIEAGDEPIIHTAVFDATSRQEYERDLLSSRRAAEASEARLRVLQQASTAFAQSITEEEVSASLHTAAAEAFSAAATGVFLLDEAGLLQLVAGTNPLADFLPHGSQKASTSALDEERSLTVSAGDESGEYPHVSAALRAADFDSVTIVPLVRHGVSLGVVASFFDEEQPFDPALGLLRAALSRQASQALVRVGLQQELARLALHDQLTGLANRHLIQETVTLAIDRSHLMGQPLSIIFLDLDGFKAVNDKLGHAVGDGVLKEISLRIRTGVRHPDTVGRYGGDEFVAICEDADSADAAAIAERIKSYVRAAITGIPESLPVTASVGVVTYVPSDRTQPTNDELLSLADSAMYRAKSAGKDRVEAVSL